MFGPFPFRPARRAGRRRRREGRSRYQKQNPSVSAGANRTSREKTQLLGGNHRQHWCKGEDPEDEKGRSEEQVRGEHPATHAQIAPLPGAIERHRGDRRDEEHDDVDRGGGQRRRTGSCRRPLTRDRSKVEIGSDRDGEDDALDDRHHDRAPPDERAAVQDRRRQVRDVERPAAHGFSWVKYHATAGGMEPMNPAGSHQTLKTEPINPIDMVIENTKGHGEGPGISSRCEGTASSAAVTSTSRRSSARPVTTGSSFSSQAGDRLVTTGMRRKL